MVTENTVERHEPRTGDWAAIRGSWNVWVMLSPTE